MPKPTPLQRTLAALVVVGGALGTLYHLGLLQHADRAAFAHVLAPFGPWAPVCFAGLVVLWVLVSFPIGVIYLAGGAALGVGPGIAMNGLGSAVGALAAFVVSRYVARDLIEARVRGRAKDLDARLGSPWPLAVMRLTAIIPFGLVSYAAGLSAMSLSRFMLVTLLAMWPPLVFCTYMGAVLHDVRVLMGLITLVTVALLVGGALKARRTAPLEEPCPPAA